MKLCLFHTDTDTVSPYTTFESIKKNKNKKTCVHTHLFLCLYILIRHFRWVHFHKYLEAFITNWVYSLCVEHHGRYSEHMCRGQSFSPHATAVTARQQILWGDLHADLGIGVDAQTVRHGLHSTKSLRAKEPRKCHRWTHRKLEKWSKSSQGHRTESLLKATLVVFTLLPSRIHRSPGPWSPSEWDSWATVLCCQTLSVDSLLQHTEPCRGNRVMVLPGAATTCTCNMSILSLLPPFIGWRLGWGVLALRQRSLFFHVDTNVRRACIMWRRPTGSCKRDSHDRQFRSLQHRTAEFLNVTVVNVMEVVTSLQGGDKGIVKQNEFRCQRWIHWALEINYLPGGVYLVDVVDHVAGQRFEAGSGLAHRQAGGQQQQGCAPHLDWNTTRFFFLKHQKEVTSSWSTY